MYVNKFTGVCCYNLIMRSSEGIKLRSSFILSESSVSSSSFLLFALLSRLHTERKNAQIKTSTSVGKAKSCWACEHFLSTNQQLNYKRHVYFRGYVRFGLKFMFVFAELCMLIAHTQQLEQSSNKLAGGKCAELRPVKLRSVSGEGQQFAIYCLPTLRHWARPPSKLVWLLLFS